MLLRRLLYQEALSTETTGGGQLTAAYYKRFNPIGPMNGLVS